MEKQKPAYRSYWMRGWLIWVLFAGFAAFIGGSIWLIIMEYQDKDSMTLGVLCLVGSIIFSVVCWLESGDSVFRLGGGRVYYRPGRGRDRALNQHLDVKEEDVLSFSYVSEKDYPSEMDNSGFMTWSFTPYLLFSLRDGSLVTISLLFYTRKARRMIVDDLCQTLPGRCTFRAWEKRPKK